MNSILIVDDDTQLRQSFKKLLSDEGYEVRMAETGEKGIEAVMEKVPDLVIMDVRMPGISGLEAFQVMHKIDPKLPVIIMTAFGTTETAIEATKLGAFDYVLKPFEIPNLLDLIEQVLEAGRFMRSRVEMNVTPADGTPDAIIGKSEVMQEIYKAIGRVAPTDATVLIRGESGTGKELVARAVYQHSLRKTKPFLVINCVAIPETLLESELFGYEKGAFTGATHRRIGKIEQANGGTVLLDEIGDMPVSIQSKILRLLEEKNIERLGGHNTIPVDVRIIAATNRNLEAACKAGNFREDLYYRLKVVTIEIPSLESRSDDVGLLTDYFLACFSKEMEIDNPGVTDEAKEILSSYAWPGNVRELANIIQKSLIFSRGYPIREKDISQAIQDDPESSLADEENVEMALRALVKNLLFSGNRDNLFGALMDKFSSIILEEVLTFTNGNRSHAAKILGLSRPTLQAKIEKFKLHINTSVKRD
jgi:DNA-binding NtrC family response regulator